MTVKNIIDQVEKMFGRLPEQYMLQLVNDLPASYIKKKYKKDHSGTWVRIYFNNE